LLSVEIRASLPPYTTYHYQAVASNAFGVVAGSDAAFSTAPRFTLAAGSNGSWDSIAWSANGEKMFASLRGALYLSTNSGAAWSAIGGPQVPTFTTSLYGGNVGPQTASFIPSSDGDKLVALSGAAFYLTTNFGATWSSNNTPANFSNFAASADLSKIVAVGGSQIYVSTNTGGTWTLASAPAANWTSLASVADGSSFFALDAENDNGQGMGIWGLVFRSTDLGSTWTEIGVFGFEDFVSSIACSADGSTLAMLAEDSFISTNAGHAWSEIPVSLEDYNVACSANGGTIIMVTGGEIYQRALYVSPDFGADWFYANAPKIPDPEPVLVTSDGTKFATLVNGNIYISEANPPPVLDVSVSSSTLVLEQVRLF
jgi:photosystem II stability/assembly factor-like uncharacterized protein